MARISIEVTAEQHRAIKMMAAAKGCSIKDFMLEQTLLPHEPYPERKFKKEVADALEESRKGIGLTRVSSVEEMFKAIGIPYDSDE